MLQVSWEREQRLHYFYLQASAMNDTSSIREKQEKIELELKELKSGQNTLLDLMAELIERFEGDSDARVVELKEEKAEYSRLFRGFQQTEYPDHCAAGWAREAIESIRTRDFPISS